MVYLAYSLLECRRAVDERKRAVQAQLRAKIAGFGGVQKRLFSRQRSKKWRVIWISLVLLLLISTITGIIIVPRLYRIDTALKSATNQALPHVKTTEQVIDIPSPTSLPKDLADLGHLNLLLRGLRHRLQI